MSDALVFKTSSKHRQPEWLAFKIFRLLTKIIGIKREVKNSQSILPDTYLLNLQKKTQRGKDDN